MKIKIIGLLFVCALATNAAEKPDSGKVVVETKSVDEKILLGKVKTIYTAQGRPTQQSRASKGWHQVADSTILVGGRATVTLNTSTAQGRQDVSFISRLTYRGMAFSLDTLSRNIYSLIPLSGTQFMIRSSDSSDAGTVNYLVEGE